MNGYPTPELLRRAALHARLHAEDYRREGRPDRAAARDADADHYELKAYQEEYRLEHLTPKMEHAA